MSGVLSMSEVIAASANVDINLSAGNMLRLAREAQGLHIAALAVSLKVPVKKLEALEADRFVDLPDAVFVRALASSVCRALKIDAVPILEKLPQTAKPRLSHTEQSINAPFRASVGGGGSSMFSAWPKSVVTAVALLLVSAAFLLFFPDVVSKWMPGSGVVSSALEPLTSATGAGNNPVNMGAGSSVGEQTSAVVPTAVVTAGMQSAGSIQSLTPALSTPTVASPTLVVSSASSLPGDSGALSQGLVAFKASGETWVEVVDAKGQTVLRRTLLAGESVASNGAVPLRVTIGRADQTQVSVRGKTFELADKVRDNVAKFEVR